MERANITEQIIRFAVITSSDDLPNSARDVFRLSLVDWVAVAMAGRNEPASEITRNACEEDGGTAHAFALGLDARLPPRLAALVNGTAGHALDYDDTHFASLGHPSAAVIPATLAIADKMSASAQAFRDASLIGMELAIRIGMWLGRDHYRTGFHITPTAGTFGATLGAARLLGLNLDQTRNALGLAVSKAGGVKAQFGSMGKPFHAGMAAANGVECASLASRGFVAAAQGLEGPQGFGETHHGRFHDDALDDLGKTFVFEEVSHKFHACCHGTHAMLEALTDLRRDHWIRPDDIVSIEITVHPQYLNICNITEPETGLEAKFSFRMVAALAMHEYDTARMETFSNGICADPKLAALRDRVKIKTAPIMAETAAAIRIETQDGAVLTGRHDLLEHTDIAEREAKVRAKVTSLIGDAASMSLWQNVAVGAQLPSDWMQACLATMDN